MNEEVLLFEQGKSIIKTELDNGKTAYLYKDGNIINVTSGVDAVIFSHDDILKLIALFENVKGESNE